MNGSLPTELGNLVSLQYLNLQINRLKGSLLNYLTTVYLSDGALV